MILVTGAAGFLGREVIHSILRSNPKQRILATYHKKKPNQVFDKKILKKVRFLRVDLSSAKSVSKIPLKFKALIHLASFIPHKPDDFDSSMNFKANVTGGWNLSRHCLQNTNLKKVILGSSMAVYGSQYGSMTEWSPCLPDHAYGESKYVSEIIFQNLSNRTGVPLTILRFSSIYGANQDQRSVLPTFINRCIKGKDLKLFQGGARYQDFIYVKDAAKAVSSALKRKKGGVYNIGYSKKTSMKSLASTVRAVFGNKKSKIINVKKRETKSSMVLSNRLAAKKTRV